jgi:transcriptional regulator
MYRPHAFAVEDRTRAEALIDAIAFGTLASVAQGRIVTSHLPLLLDRSANVLRGHFAKANPHWRALDPNLDVLVTFVGPNAYVSPSWYRSAGLVPTWNYVAIDVRGRIEILPERADRLAIVTALSARHERAFAKPWTIDKVPARSLDALLDAIVAFRIAIDTIEAKAKLSQNRLPADTEAVADALESQPGRSMPSDVAQLMRSFSGARTG